MKRESLTENKLKQLKPRNRPYKVIDGTVGWMFVHVRQQEEWGSCWNWVWRNFPVLI